MHLRYLSYLFGFAGFLVQASTVPNQGRLDKMSPRAVLNSLDLKSEHSAEQSTGPADYSDLMMVQRADGGIEIIKRPQSEPETDTLISLAKRWSLPSQVCNEASTSTCTFRTESAKCIDISFFQVYCAGCFNNNKGKGVQKLHKQSCKAGQTCVDTRFVNDWGENTEYVMCLPSQQAVRFVALTQKSTPIDVRGCSPGLSNTAGRDVKVELTVDSYDSAGHYLVTPRSSSLVLNGKIIETAARSAYLAADVVLRHGSSAQGCLTTIGNFYQQLSGRFAVSFAF